MQLKEKERTNNGHNVKQKNIKMQKYGWDIHISTWEKA